MVMLHVKKKKAAAAVADADEDNEFLYECLSTSSIDDVADAVIEISRLQSQIETLTLRLRRESSMNVSASLDRALSEAEAYASKAQVVHKQALSARVLRDHVRKVDKEMSAVSKGMCDSEVLRFFSDCEHQEYMKLWWAGKELKKGNKLCDYIGKNEKTKLQKKNQPLRKRYQVIFGYWSHLRRRPI